MTQRASHLQLNLGSDNKERTRLTRTFPTGLIQGDALIPLSDPPPSQHYSTQTVLMMWIVYVYGLSSHDEKKAEILEVIHIILEEKKKPGNI